MFAINLGGEGEIPDVLNQQPPLAAEPGWLSVNGQPLLNLLRLGLRFLLCPNDAIALPDECADRVYTSSVPIDTSNAWFGTGVQSSEIRRIWKRGGEWIRDGVLFHVKP